MPGPGKSKSASRSVLELLGILAVTIVFAFLLLPAFLVKPFKIPSESMLPNILPGDRILVNRLTYRIGSIERGDIIVFKSPTDPEVDYVKRVIAVAGDTVELKRGQVILNGEPLDEPYPVIADNSTFPSQTVPEGTLFVLGDNRGDSQDSRFWRPPWLPAENVVGKAFVTYWPPDRLGKL